MKHQHLIKLVLYHAPPPLQSSKICDCSPPLKLPSLRHRRTTTSPHSPPIHLPTSSINDPPLSVTHNPPIILHSQPNFPPCQPKARKHTNSIQLPYLKPSSFSFISTHHHSYGGR